MSAPPKPLEIVLRRAERVLHMRFKDGAAFDLPAEYLRVYSPSAELTGHGGAERRFPPGKSDVAIDTAEPVGRYALRLVFSDGHDTGLYTWKWLRELGETREEKWDAYLAALARQGLSRERA